MAEKPKIVKTGFRFGILGGLIAFIATIMAFVPEIAGSVNVGLGALVTVLFFALGGMFMTGGRGSRGAMVFMAALVTGVTVAITMYGSINVWFGIILTIIGAVEIIVAVSSATGRWIKTDRLAS